MMNRLLFLDIEATGLDPANDRIVELCLYPFGTTPTTRRFNPGIPIAAEATAVHGIRDEDVADCPRFRQVAASVQRIIEGRILCGYSIRTFDSLILDAELRRAGQHGLLRDDRGKIIHPELDLYSLWRECEPRSLVGAAARFAGVDLLEAHSAQADTEVLPRVLDGMVRDFGLGDRSIDELCSICVPAWAVDRDAKFKRREDGEIVYNFGQNRGMPVRDELGLLRWMLRKDFSDDTKAVAQALLDEFAQPEPEPQTVPADGTRDLFETDDDLPF